MSDPRPRPASVVPTPWLAIPDAAAYLRVTPSVIKREMNRGRLRYVRVTRDQRITRQEWCDQWGLDHACPVTVPPLSVLRGAR